MNKNKIYSLIFIVALIVSLSSILVQTPNVKAMSVSTTGISAYGVDNNQETFAVCGGLNIYAMDNKLVMYDDNAVLQKTFNLPSFACSPIGSGSENASRTTIKALDSNELLIATIYCYNNQAGLYMYLGIQAEILSISTLSYYTIADTFIDGSLAGNSYNYAFCLGTGNVILTNINATGSFYYVVGSGEQLGTGTNTYMIQSGICYLGKYTGNGQWTAGFSVLHSIHSSNPSSSVYVDPNTLAIDSDTFSTLQGQNVAYYVTSNNFMDASRAQIFAIYFNSSLGSIIPNYLGITSTDYTYCSFATVNNANSPTFTYLLGISAYNSKIEINFVTNTEVISTVDGLQFETIEFNSTYINCNYIVQYGLQGVRSNSIVRAYSGVVPQNSVGNESGYYAISYFSNVFHTQIGIYADGYTLTGLTAQLTGLETDNPVWTLGNLFYLWTPQQPIKFPFDTFQYGGFQEINSGIGSFIDYKLMPQIQAETMINNAPTFSFAGLITGGIYSNSQVPYISSRPVELQQNLQYVFTGKIYQSQIQSGDGNVSIGLTSLSSDMQTGLTPNPTSYVTTSFSGGQFSFVIAPSPVSQYYLPIWRKMVVNFTLDTGESYLATYALVFTGNGHSYNDGTGNSTPTPTPNGNNGGGGISTVLPIIPNGYTTYIAILVYMVCIVGLIYGFYMLHNSNIPFAVALGLIVATIVCNFLNVLGFYTYPIDALVIVAVIGILFIGRGS